MAPDPGSSKDDHHGSHKEPDSQRMTNADFRKMMMTPRSDKNMTAMGALALGAGNSTLGGTTPKVGGTSSSGSGQGAASENKELSEKAEKRKKKKSFYAKLKRQEDDKMAELAAKYRDRAAERRDGVPDKPENSRDGEDTESAEQKAASHTSQTGGGYRAVAPDIQSTHDQTERRRQMIQESKFLGGDMEHTHLVKGLDFALLQKVRSEIASREKVSIDDDVLENIEATSKQNKGISDKISKYKDEELDLKTKKEIKEVKSEESEDQVVCRTTMAKNIVRTVFKTDLPERNELFFPGRMAYTMDLDEIDESQDDPDSTNPHSDIPTTTIRSKADVQGNLAHQQAVSLSANDIVINKLTQILSYLRAAGTRGKKKKKDKLVPQLPNPKSDPVAAAAIAKGHGAELPIFDDTGDYVPDYTKRSDKSSNNVSSRDRDRDRRDRDKGYSRSGHRDRERDRDRDRDRDRRDEKGSSRSYFDKRDEEEEHKKGFSSQDKEMIKKMLKHEEEKTKKEEENQNAQQNAFGTYLSANNPEGYSECYPGIDTGYGMDDSDEEVDYTKMDLGNKKGPVGRWDFDTAEEYADYMSQKEAMPKAAFQYGVKMAEGRKTRGKVGQKNEKAKLDKEWNKISSLIDKRKGPSGVMGGHKRAKYE